MYTVFVLHVTPLLTSTCTAVCSCVISTRKASWRLLLYINRVVSNSNRNGEVHFFIAASVYQQGNEQ